MAARPLTVRRAGPPAHGGLMAITLAITGGGGTNSAIREDAVQQAPGK